jgi:hypothetical protein
MSYGTLVAFEPKDLEAIYTAGPNQCVSPPSGSEKYNLFSVLQKQWTKPKTWAFLNKFILL